MGFDEYNGSSITTRGNIMKVRKPIHKTILCLAASTLILMNTSAAQAQNTQQQEATMKEATYIPFSAKSGQDKNLADFLIEGAKLVTQTEPNTLYWYALKKTDGSFGIVDFFPNEAGRSEHFAGKVAAALNANADSLVAEGWDKGVVANISNATVLSYKTPSKDAVNATQATYIVLNAQTGKEQALEQLLTGAATVIEQTEPKTLLWTSLKLDHNTFGIFDTFSDESGRQAHFAGKVAAALKAQADHFVVGGWEEGVLKNIHNFEVIAEAEK
jgi:quinol monooxygenase YgiN